MGRIEEAIHAGVNPVEEERVTLLLGVVQGEPLLRVCVGERTLTLPE